MTNVHLCLWASQPDIKIECDGSWTTPAWKTSVNKELVLDEGVYESADRSFYTFETEKATCPPCRCIGLVVEAISGKPQRLLTELAYLNSFDVPRAAALLELLVMYVRRDERAVLEAANRRTTTEEQGR